MSKEEPSNVSAKIDAAVIKQAKVIAASRDMTLTDYLTGLLREPVKADWLKFLEHANSEAKNARK